MAVGPARPGHRAHGAVRELRRRRAAGCLRPADGRALMARVVVLNPLPFYQPYSQERTAVETLGATFHADAPPDGDLLAEATILLSHSVPMDAAFFERVPKCQLI